MLRQFAFALALPFLLPAQDRVDALLRSLSLEQKAGQLFVSWSLSRAEQGNHDKLLAWVRDAGLGGVILSLGSVDDAAALVPQLQAAAQVPLLLAGDFEGGVWFRLTGATELGNQMLFGATRSEWLTEQAGRITGEEAKALGFHWVFAPVLDVNSNPANPIINVRSFGEDPDLVARLGRAFARGVRGAGLLACGKHFPGHGDVDSDSHLDLPTVPGDRERLHRVELVPFAAAAKDGLESVMTGHLAVPGLGEDPKLPATLSHHILTDVLRDELGFTGLVVTDALEMGGVKNAFPPGEVAVRALLAGADVLLMPPDPFAARAAVVAAVQQGRVPLARLDDAVRRILMAKDRVGLLAGGGKVAADWRAGLRTRTSERIADAIAARGLTLVRDRGELLLHRAPKADTVVVRIADRDEGLGATFAERLGDLAETTDLALSGSSTKEIVAAAAERIGRKKRVVLALFAKVRSGSGGIALPAAVAPALAALRDDQEVVAVSFGNPYLVAQLPVIDSYVCAFLGGPRVEAAAAQVVLGAGAVTGRLPVSIPGVAPAGAGLTSYRSSLGLTDGRPEQFEVDTELPARLEQRLAAAVADGAFPGAVCVVARNGWVIARVAVGHRSYAADAERVFADTPFDLASLTKVTATTPAILRLVAAGKLGLDDPVQKWVPAFAGTGKERVTVRHLLAHCGGLPAYERYYRTLRGRDAIVDAAAKEGLMYEPGTGTTYSDLGFILLMAVVEKASGEPFATFVQREVFAPLQMHDAAFAPTDGPPRAGAAPTEDDPDRGGIVTGAVHDENAFAMGGVSGHAGLFATADDVMRLGLMLMGGGRGFLPRELVAAATSPAGLVPGDRTRGVGYQMLQPGTWAGSAVSPGTFGHTGFTGTSLWCDPELDVCVVLLTNRVHPTRVNNKIQQVRREVHDLVRAAVH
ncbi:MAG: glycoside hydrolase family 3 N-terminal domain-containing protein [Planctomycetota bacterium]